MNKNYAFQVHRDVFFKNKNAFETCAVFLILFLYVNALKRTAMCFANMYKVCMLCGAVFHTGICCIIPTRVNISIP